MWTKINISKQSSGWCLVKMTILIPTSKHKKNNHYFITVTYGTVMNNGLSFRVFIANYFWKYGCLAKLVLLWWNYTQPTLKNVWYQQTWLRMKWWEPFWRYCHVRDKKLWPSTYSSFSSHQCSKFRNKLLLPKIEVPLCIKCIKL